MWWCQKKLNPKYFLIICWVHCRCSVFNSFQDGEGRVGAKILPTRFSPVTSQKVEISPNNFLTFIFKSFVTILKNFKAITSTSPELLNLNQDQLSLQKIFFFWSNPYKTEVIITSPLEVLELPNVGHINTYKILFEPRDKILLVTSWTKIMTSWNLFQNTF